MAVELDSRVIRIALWLLEQDSSRSTADLAKGLGLSERVVRYRLGVVERYLGEHGATLVRERGRGLRIDCDADTRQEMFRELREWESPLRVHSPEERTHIVIAALLSDAPSVVPLERLADRLSVSKTSARRDLARAEPWLERLGVSIARRSGKGLELVANERRTRRALVQLILEAVPAEVLHELQTTPWAEAEALRTRVPAGLREVLAPLPIARCSAAVRESTLQEALSTPNAELVFSLYLAVTLARHELGRLITLDAGQLVSLLDHPVRHAVDDLNHTLSAGGVGELDGVEVAGLTEYVLGLDALREPEPDIEGFAPLLNELLDSAAERLHSSLADDAELRRGLSLHFDRLRIRLRHGLPVHNPLRHEVAARYPDVHALSREFSDRLAEAVGQPVSDDEIAFVTMYLSGALERAHLRPQRRALLVCPSGMATVWVLVSRIKSEFPELEIHEVLSEREYLARDEIADIDLVITTVPLEASGPPVVVVGPLVSNSDVRAVRAHL